MPSLIYMLGGDGESIVYIENLQVVVEELEAISAQVEELEEISAVVEECS